jgi:hypothetical protein
MALTVIGLGGVAYAGVLSLPNPPFNSGDVISSSAVNANFNFLVSRMGAYKYSQGTTVSNLTNCQTIHSISFTAPQNGYVIVRASASHVDTVQMLQGAVMVYLYLNQTSNLCSSSDDTDMAIIGMNKFDPDIAHELITYNSFNLEHYYTVTGGTVYTFYLNGFKWQGQQVIIALPRLSVQFVPSEL